MKNSNKAIRLMILSIVCMFLSACASQTSLTSSSYLDRMIDDAIKGKKEKQTTEEKTTKEDPYSFYTLVKINTKRFWQMDCRLQ